MQKNRIEVAGFLASAPVRRFLPSGEPVANVRMGESYTWTDSDGKAQKHTNWHSLSFYGKLAEVAVTYEKGDNVFVEGNIEQRQFTPKDGSPRTVNEIKVRSSHLIAQPRPANGRAKDPQETAPPEAEKGQPDDWPVA